MASAADTSSAKRSTNRQVSTVEDLLQELKVDDAIASHSKKWPDYLPRKGREKRFSVEELEDDAESDVQESTLDQEKCFTAYLAIWDWQPDRDLCSYVCDRYDAIRFEFDPGSSRLLFKFVELFHAKSKSIHS